MNHFILPPSELMKAWKELRNKIESGDHTTDLEDVVEFWSLAPLKKYAYDFEALDTWPSPWEMMQNNDWCINSIAVGMEFTFRLSGYDSTRMKLKLIRDYDISDQMIVLEIDETHWLNYKYRTVSPIPSTNHDVLSVWSYNGRRYTQC